MAKLTKRLVESAKPSPRDSVIWDDEVHGFGLRVKPSGRKSYVIQYRTSVGQISRRMTLGPHGVYTVDKARERARRLLQSVRDGRDPAVERETARAMPTIRQIGERYLEEYARPKKRPLSVRSDQSNLTNHIYREFGDRLASDIKRADIMRLRFRMRATPGAANRTISLLSKLFNLTESWGIRPDNSNPCRHVERYPERKMERFLSTEEMKRLGDALAEAARTQSVPTPAIAAIRLLVFTGCRVSEILNLRWDEVDEERGCLRLAVSKTGAKTIHLSAPAREALVGMQRRDRNPYVIVGRGEGHFTNLRRPWLHIRTAADLRDVRLHDLRHSFASVGVAGGLSLPVLGALLGHTQPATTQRYAHLAADPLKQATDLIGQRIAAAMKGESGDVVTFAKNGKNRRG
jgi:integrase